MKAESCDGGYLLNGHVPWITGWSFYPEFLIGATLPDGQAVFGVVPLKHAEDKNGKITISEPMRLAARSISSAPVTTRRILRTVRHFAASASSLQSAAIGGKTCMCTDPCSEG